MTLVRLMNRGTGESHHTDYSTEHRRKKETDRPHIDFTFTVGFAGFAVNLPQLPLSTNTE